MELKKNITVVFAFGLFILLNGCNGNNPTTTGSANTGSVKISIMGMGADGTQTLGKSFGENIDITSAKVVIEKIEFENDQDASLDVKLQQPFVQDLVTLTSLQEIETVEIPFGVYNKIKITIDDLDAEDGEVFTLNPDLQNLSVLVKGFLNNDSTQTFEFSSDLTANIELEFDPPLEINEELLATNIVLGIDFAKWFRGHNGRFLDPTRPENRSEIENNIKRSLQVFEDRDEDGKRDHDHGDDEDAEVKGAIQELGDDFLIVSDSTFHVDDNTIVEGDDDHPISFADLQVGFFVEVHAVRRDDGSLLATRIEVENDHRDHDNEDTKARGPISEIGENSLVVSGVEFLVTAETRIEDANGNHITFSDLEVGMFVEVQAIRQEDGTLVATEIEIENEHHHG